MPLNPWAMMETIQAGICDFFVTKGTGTDLPVCNLT